MKELAPSAPSAPSTVASALSARAALRAHDVACRRIAQADPSGSVRALPCLVGETTNAVTPSQP